MIKFVTKNVEFGHKNPKKQVHTQTVLYIYHHLIISSKISKVFNWLKLKVKNSLKTGPKFTKTYIVVIPTSKIGPILLETDRRSWTKHTIILRQNHISMWPSY